MRDEKNQPADEKETVSGAPGPDKLTSADAASNGDAGEAETAEREGAEAVEEPAQADEAGEAGEAEEAGEAKEAEAEEAEADRAADAEPSEEPPAAAEPQVAALEADVDDSAELAAAQAEAEGYLDNLRRLQAEFDNYRKRTLRDQTARAAAASQALVARLLPVLDNFELAVSAAEQSRDFDRMLKGVEMVFGELREVLQSEGLVKIEAEGKPFDPERHEAVLAVELEDAEPGTVVDVVRTGYELRGRVLRPAMVKVAR